MQQRQYSDVKVEGYSHISSVVSETNKRLQDIRQGLIKPIVTRSKKETEKIGGFFLTDQVVLAARTGMGKTAKVLNMMGDFVDPTVNPHYAEDIIILYDSWEMPGWRNMLRFYSRANKLTVKELLDYQKALDDERFQRILQISKQFEGQPIYIRSISQSSHEWYESKCRIQDANPKKKIVNIVDHSRLVSKTNENSEEALITGFMKIGMKLKIEQDQLNIFLSQMNRAVETAGKREDMGKATPVSSDIFGSDGVFQCADVVLALHRPGYYNLVDWEGLATGKVAGDPNASDYLMIECILKQRDGWTGNLAMYHDLAHNQFFDTIEELREYKQTVSGIIIPKQSSIFDTTNEEEY